VASCRVSLPQDAVRPNCAARSQCSRLCISLGSPSPGIELCSDIFLHGPHLRCAPHRSTLNSSEQSGDRDRVQCAPALLCSSAQLCGVCPLLGATAVDDALRPRPHRRAACDRGHLACCRVNPVSVPELSGTCPRAHQLCVETAGHATGTPEISHDSVPGCWTRVSPTH